MTQNQEQFRYWNEIAGPLWVSWTQEFELHTGLFGKRAIERAGLGGGEKVLDVGCGCGASSIRLGRAVGPNGSVLGVDISAVMLAAAVERKKAAKQDNVEFRQLDAQESENGLNDIDLVFSQFGVMFFEDPVAAFTNLRSTLREDGRFVFTCWQAPSKNPWMAIPNQKAMEIFAISAPQLPIGSPGPFSLAEQNRIHEILGYAGFASIEVTSDEDQIVWPSSESLNTWAERRLLMGPARDIYSQCPPETQLRAREELIDSIASYIESDKLSMPAAAWIVTAIA